MDKLAAAFIDEQWSLVADVIYKLELELEAAQLAESAAKSPMRIADDTSSDEEEDSDEIDSDDDRDKEGTNTRPLD